MQYCKAIAGQSTGFSALVVVVMLAMISASVVALSVNKSHRQTQTLVAQKSLFDTEVNVEQALNSAVTSYILSGDVDHPELSNTDVNISLDQHITFKQQKQAEVIEIRAVKVIESARTVASKVSLLKQRRLEAYPNARLTQAPSANLQYIASQYFHSTTDELNAFKYQTSNFLADCERLNENARGLIWISSNCELSNMQLGTQNRPILLIVEGDLTLTGSTIHGLVFQLCGDTSELLNTTFIHSLLYGAVISTCNIPSTSIQNYEYGVVYDAALLQSLISHQDNIQISFIEGSWQYN